MKTRVSYVCCMVHAHSSKFVVWFMHPKARTVSLLYGSCTLRGHRNLGSTNPLVSVWFQMCEMKLRISFGTIGGVCGIVGTLNSILTSQAGPVRWAAGSGVRCWYLCWFNVMGLSCDSCLMHVPSCRTSINQDKTRLGILVNPLAVQVSNKERVTCMAPCY